MIIDIQVDYVRSIEAGSKLLQRTLIDYRFISYFPNLERLFQIFMKGGRSIISVSDLFSFQWHFPFLKVKELYLIAVSLFVIAYSRACNLKDSWTLGFLFFS